MGMRTACLAKWGVRIACLMFLMSLLISGVARAGGYTLWRNYYYNQYYTATLDISNSDSRLASGLYCTENEGNTPWHSENCKAKSTGDWDEGALKAECGWDYTSSGGPFALDMIKGISSYDYNYEYYTGTLPRRIHGVLCGNVGGSGTPSPVYWLDYSRYTATRAGWTYDAYSTLNYDWAYGFWKRDCGPKELMVGISTKPDQTPGFLCRPTVFNGGVSMPTPGNPTCQVVTVKTSDNRPGSEKPLFPLDWDYGYVKTECPRVNGVDYYMNGIAVAPWTSKIQSILCCQPAN